MSTRRQRLITVSLGFLVGYLLFPRDSDAEDPLANAFDAYLASVRDGQAPFSFDRSDYDCSADQRAELPIGVFDSGVGGLTALEAIFTSDLFDNETLKPGPDGHPDFEREKFIYLGDQANMPYGNYSRENKTEYLRELILKDATFLLGRRHRTSVAAKPRFDKPPVKAIVIACNTATAYGLDDVRSAVERWRIPVVIVGVVEAGTRGLLKVEKNENNAIGVLATVGTCASGVYPRIIQSTLGRAGRPTAVITQHGSRDLAAMIEGEPGSETSLTRQIASDVRALVENHRRSREGKSPVPIGTIVLGCTHFPLVVGEIESAFVQLRRDSSFEPFIAESRHYIDPAVWAARELFVESARRRIRATSKTSPSIKADAFYFSVPNPKSDEAIRAADGGLDHAYKYGRQVGNFTVEDTVVVPMTRAGLPSSSRELVREKLPETWSRLPAGGADDIEAPPHVPTRFRIKAESAAPDDAAEGVIFSDNFADGKRDGWFEIDDDSSALSVKSTSSQLSSSPELNFTASDTSSLKTLAVHVSRVTLKNPGEFVTLRFDTRHNNVGFVNGGFRFGLLDSGGTQFTADGDLDSHRVSLDDEGYSAMLDLGSSTTNESAVIRESDNASDERLWNGSTIAFDDNDGDPDPLMFSRDRNFTYTLTLIRNSDGNLDIVLKNSVSGDAGALTGTSNLTPTLTFDTIYFGINGSTADLAIDNVTVTNNLTAAAQPSTENIRVGVYFDEGAGPSVKDLLFVLEKCEDVSIRRLKADEIWAGALVDLDVLIQPGGSGSGQGNHLGEEGREAICEFVRDGGGFIGICGGAYLASAHYKWSLDILDAQVVDTMHWARGHGNVKIGITDAGQALLNTKESQLTILYWQGPLLAPANRPEIEDYETIATFDTEIAENGAPKGVMKGTTAIAKGQYGRGRVVCFSPHPEMTDGLHHLIPLTLGWVAGADR